MTTKKASIPESRNSVIASVLLYSLLFFSGGILCLMGDTLLGASSFALAAVFSSISTPWTKIPSWAKVTLVASTLFGIFGLFFSIFTV